MPQLTPRSPSQKAIRFFLFGFVLLFFSNCRPRLQPGVRMVLQVETAEMLVDLARGEVDAPFRAALQRAVDGHLEELGLLPKFFTEELSKEYTAMGKPVNDRLLIKYFLTRESGLGPLSTNQEVEAYLVQEVEQSLRAVQAILEARVAGFGILPAASELDLARARISLDLPGLEDAPRVARLLERAGDLGFWETHTYSEAYPMLQRIDSAVKRMEAQDSTLVTAVPEPEEEAPKLTGLDSIYAEAAGEDTEPAPSVEEFKAEHPFFGKFNLKFPMDPNRPLVGLVALQDTAQINSYLRAPEVRKYIPATMKLLWEVAPYVDNYGLTDGEFKDQIGLICIKTDPTDQAPVSGKMIVHAVQDFEMNSAAALVSMEMNAEGSEKWARLTGNNIGRCIAIVLDDRVYSYPNVQGKIVGGRSQISGNFTIEEARDLANILVSGSLPGKVTVLGTSNY